MFGKLRVRFSLWNLFSAILIVLTSLGFTRTPSANAAPYCPGIPFDPINFSNPTTIDNEYLPMVPGTKLVLEGTADRGGGTKPHRVIFIVTDMTKVINGVRTVVVYDRDFQDGQLAERELAFFAQDDEGNVWNLGEYPEEFEDGQFIGAPSTWLAGVGGAEGGVHMHGTPIVGGPRYSQGYAADIEFLDCAKVISKNLKVEVPSGAYENVLLTDEVSPFDPGGGHQRKYHAPGVGIVQIGAVGDPEAETLSLTRVAQLDQKEYEDVRAEVRNLDARGHIVSPNVYGQTPSLEQLPPQAADTLVSPSANITITNPSYTWNVVPSATWYYLWVNQINSDGTHTVLHNTWYLASQVCGASTCSVTPSVTLPAGSYIWWIQTWNDGGYGPWSNGKSFNVQTVLPPGAATLISPGGSITDTTPTYAWNQVSSSTWYYLWVNNAAGAPVIQQWYAASQICGSSTCSLTPNVPLTGGNYTWWIQTWNDGGYGPWSSAMNFSLP